MDRLPLFSTLFCLLSNQLPASGFQAPRPALLHSRRHVTSTTRISAVQIDEYATRDYDSFVEWGNNYGLSQENGFQLSEQFGEWGIMAGQNAQAGSRLLFVPAMLRITSSRVRQEEFPQLEPAIAQFFDATNSKGQQNLDCQFYLFLKVLQEYEQQESSPYYAWLNALPRKFRTALTFDPFEMECLPPFVKYLASLDYYNYELFMDSLQSLDIPSISWETKNNAEVTKWAFNVVFTRARAAFGESEIIPMADMFNHAAIPNVEVQYDNEGNVNVMLLRDAQQGEPLFKCYGQHTNPSHFLATYGFFDTSPPATYCKLLCGQTRTPELVNMGFDYERMVFYPENGGIADEVWDVMLYTILEQTDPAAKEQFYNAHMQGDAQTKASFHEMYFAQTSDGLVNHVDEMLNELASCANTISQGQGAGYENLEMISQHNNFVRETFLKVRENLVQMRGY